MRMGTGREERLKEKRRFFLPGRPAGFCLRLLWRRDISGSFRRSGRSSAGISARKVFSGRLRKWRPGLLFSVSGLLPAERLFPLRPAVIRSDVCSSFQHRKRIEYVHHSVYGSGFLVCYGSLEAKQMGYRPDGFCLYPDKYVAIRPFSRIPATDFCSPLRTEGITLRADMVEIML